MNGITTKLMVVLLVLGLSQYAHAIGQAVAALMADISGKSHKVDDKTPVVEYKTSDPYDEYQMWYKNIKNVTESYVVDGLNILAEDSPAMYIDQDEYIQNRIGLSTIRMVTVWNRMINRYPESKNARSAFCKYGKEIQTVSKDVKKCDKNFQFNPQKSPMPLGPDYKAVMAPPLK